jgi:hypothetical protein
MQGRKIAAQAGAACPRRTYRRPKPRPADYRPLVAVIAIVIFSLALIAFRGEGRQIVDGLMP